MKVFISWSGDRSKAIAHVLRTWLPRIVPAVVPYMSEVDNEAGDRWGPKIAAELDQANYGIMCLTPENLGSPWLLFESGAIGKSVEEGHVIPLLYELDFTDVKQPLGQFHGKKVTKEDMRSLCHTLNQACQEARSEPEVNTVFDLMWDKVEQELARVPKRTEDDIERRSTEDKLDEVLSLARSLMVTNNEMMFFIERGGMTLGRRRPNSRSTMADRMEYRDIESLVMARLDGLVTEILIDADKDIVVLLDDSQPIYEDMDIKDRLIELGHAMSRRGYKFSSRPVSSVARGETVDRGREWVSEYLKRPDA